MSIINFRPKDRWMAADMDGTVKVFKQYPMRATKEWKGKGCQIVGEKHREGLSINWDSSPIRVIEHKAYEVCDLQLV